MEMWFSEFHTPDVKHSIRVNRQLYSRQSEYQRIDIFETPEFGRVLTLDGNVMLTERDEFIYDEMITHVPMSVHKEARDILVIGADPDTSLSIILYSTNIVGRKTVRLCVLFGCSVSQLITEYSFSFCSNPKLLWGGRGNTEALSNKLHTLLFFSDGQVITFLCLDIEDNHSFGRSNE